MLLNTATNYGSADPFASEFGSETLLSTYGIRVHTKRNNQSILFRAVKSFNLRTLVCCHLYGWDPPKSEGWRRNSRCSRGEESSWPRTCTHLDIYRWSLAIIIQIKQQSLVNSLTKADGAIMNKNTSNWQHVKLAICHEIAEYFPFQSRQTHQKFF
jgi:hypothetical protein